MLEIGKVGWVEKPKPVCGPMDAVCRPLAAAVCTSDVHTVWEGAVGERHDMILGHECCAEVVSVGELVRDFQPGDRVLVKVTQLNRDDPDDIRVAASVKQVAANPVDKALEKIEVNSNYAGTVTLTDSTGIFVRLDMGAECRCRFPYRARPPKGARVVVKIAGVDMEQKTVWGNITYVTIPK